MVPKFKTAWQSGTTRTLMSPLEPAPGHTRLRFLALGLE